MSYKIAVGSSDEINVDLKFGEVSEFLIYEVDDNFRLVERRALQVGTENSACSGNGNGCGCGGSKDIVSKVTQIEDCRCVVCKKIGFQAQKQLEKKAISVFDVECSIENALEKITLYYSRVDKHERFGNYTKCIHIENDDEDSNHFGAISYPIYQTATYAHPGVGMSTGYDYSRLQNPTREQLEKIVCQLEEGVDALALSSGMAAITLVFELFKPGDHIIAESDLYGGSRRLFDKVSVKNGYEFTYLNFSRDDYVSEIKENTKAIYIETPTNPMMNVADIAAIAHVAKENDILLIVDNTFLSPHFQKPLKLGADIVVHSGTKFLGGHNDALAGFIVTNNDKVQKTLRELIKTTGAGLAPFDSWLMIRGIKTLGVRMEKSEKNALDIARWLKKTKARNRCILSRIKRASWIRDYETSDHRVWCYDYFLCRYQRNCITNFGESETYKICGEFRRG